MKISKTMNLRRLARSVSVTASTAAGWREVRRQLVARHNSADTATVTLGELWQIQEAAWAAEAIQDVVVAEPCSHPWFRCIWRGTGGAKLKPAPPEPSAP